MSSPSSKPSASISSSPKPFPSQETLRPPKFLSLISPREINQIFQNYPTLATFYNYLYVVTSQFYRSRDQHSCVLSAYLQNCCADPKKCGTLIGKRYDSQIDLICVITAFMSCSLIIVKRLLIQIFSRCSQCTFSELLIR